MVRPRSLPARLLRITLFVASMLAAVSACGDDNAIRARLERLKELREAGLIPEAVYVDEVRRTLRQLGLTPPPDPVPPPREFPLPRIDWGGFTDYFEISGLRTGVYAYNELTPSTTKPGNDPRHTGAVLRASTVLCHVKAKRQFPPDIARFQFRGYGADGDLLIPATPIAFDRQFHQRTTEYWPIGGQAIAYLPIYDKDLTPARVTHIKVSVRDVTDFKVPTINWGNFEDYFEISNPRTGIHKYIGATFREAEGGTAMAPRTAPAILIDARAKKAFLAKVIFKAVAYDRDGDMVSPNIELVFDIKYSKRSGVDWAPGDQAVVYIPFKQPDFDPAVVHRMDIKITDPFDFPLPKIDWTVLKELFSVTNVRSGPYYASEQEVVPALVFDVEAKFAFTLATASFAARLYDEDNKTVGSARRVQFEHEFFVRTARDAMTRRGPWKGKWPKGGRATAFIPFHQIQSEGRKTAAGDVDPAAVYKIVIFQSYGRVMR